jgi:hypothetical protein
MRSSRMVKANAEGVKVLCSTSASSGTVEYDGMAETSSADESNFKNFKRIPFMKLLQCVRCVKSFLFIDC